MSSQIKNNPTNISQTFTLSNTNTCSNCKSPTTNTNQTLKVSFICRHTYCSKCSILLIFSSIKYNLKEDSFFDSLLLKCLHCEQTKEVSSFHLSQVLNKEVQRLNDVLEKEKLLVNSSIYSYEGSNFNEDNDNNTDNISIIDMHIHMCNECKVNKSSIYCNTCLVYICNKCDIHEKYNYLKSHQRVNINIKQLNKEESQKTMSKIEKINENLKKINEKNVFSFKKSSISRIISELNKTIDEISNFTRLLTRIVESYINYNSNCVNKEEIYLNTISFLSKIQFQFEETSFLEQVLFQFESYLKEYNEANHHCFSHDSNNNDNDCIDCIDNHIKYISNSIHTENNQFSSCLLSTKISIESTYNIFNNLNSKLTSQLSISTKQKLSNLLFVQNIECENIQIIHRPNIFTVLNPIHIKNEVWLVWIEKNEYNNSTNHSIVVYDLVGQSMKSVLNSQSSMSNSIFSIKSNSLYILSLGNENVLWSVQTLLPLCIIHIKDNIDDNISVCLTGELINNDLFGLVVNKHASQVEIYNINGEIVLYLQQNILVLNMIYYVNPISNEEYLILCGMLGDENGVGQCDVLKLPLIQINTKTDTKTDTKTKNINTISNITNVQSEDSLNNSQNQSSFIVTYTNQSTNSAYSTYSYPYSSLLYRSYQGPKSFFIMKAHIFLKNSDFFIFLISQNGEATVYSFETKLIISKVKFFSLCDYCLWNDSTVILLGDELNNYIVYSLLNNDVIYISNKDNSYSVNAMKIQYEGVFDGLIVLDSNSNFKIYN